MCRALLVCARGGMSLRDLSLWFYSLCARMRFLDLIQFALLCANRSTNLSEPYRPTFGRQ